MNRTLLAIAILIGAAPLSAAQTTDGSLEPTADRFREDLRGIAHVASTAALIFADTGAWPDTPFALLGSSQATRTGLRAFQLSDLQLSSEGDALRIQMTPLPSPYVSDDRIVEATISRAENGEFLISHEITRRADPDDGAKLLAYDHADGLEIGRAFGTLCVDLERVRQMLAQGDYEPDPTRLSATPLTVRVTPPGETAPTYYLRSDPSRQP